MIKYMTFDQLLDEVQDELELYDKNSLIEPSTLIPVITKINKELGLKVTEPRQEIIHFENYVAKLPNNLGKVNYIVCLDDRQAVDKFLPQGIHKDYKEIDLLTETDLSKEVYVTPDGFVYQSLNTYNRPSYYMYRVMQRLRIVKTQSKTSFNSPDECVIKGDYLKLNLEEGHILVDYQATMEDEDGNLLVVDHPLIQDYYKYALKRRIFENMYFNGEEAALQKLQFIETRYIKAKQEANGVVDMPEFSELKQTLDINKTAMFMRYHSKFI